MLPIYICDDDPVWLQRLNMAVISYQIKSDFDIKVEYKTSSPTDLLHYLEGHPSINGIYFLDINLKASMDGLSLAEHIRKKDPSAFIIFVTIHDEMAMETFRLKLEVLDYIIKDYNNMETQLHLCLEHIECCLTQQIKRLNNIIIHERGSCRVLPVDEIYYVETLKNSHKIYFHLHSAVYIVSASLASIQGQLGDSFIQCHRTCIVNLNHITELDCIDNKIYLDNGDFCECSVRQRKYVIQKLKGKV